MKPQLRYLPPLLITVSTFLYIVLLFYTPRQSFYQLMLLFAALFILYLSLVQSSKNQDTRYLILTAAIFYLIPLLPLVPGFASWVPLPFPNLSDDYFRFVWDGRLLASETNPFAMLPSELIADPELALKSGLTQELYDGLNSKNYFTIYPPVLQGIFYLSALISPKSIFGAVMIMKVVIFGAGMGSVWLIMQLLKKFSLPVSLVSWYAFNPLIIVELGGNLHFEALMIFFLLWAFLWLSQGKWLLSAIPFALAVGSKLLPLMLLPLLIRRLGWRNAVIYGALVLLLTLIQFVPIFDTETFLNLFDSIELYFQKFEFNAGLYYLIRWVGYQITGYNIIQIIGKYLALITLGGILLYTFMEKSPGWRNFPRAVMWIFLFYFSLATIVHPWYCTTLIAFGLFTRFRFPVLWSGLILLSYFTYRTNAYEENLWLNAIEYIFLTVFIAFELYKQKSSENV